MANFSEEPVGLLTISAAADLAQFKLVPLIEGFLARYPRVTVDLKITNTRVDLVSDGIDLAVRVGTLSDSSLIMRRFFDAQLGLWASADYLSENGEPEAVQDLADHRFVRMTRAPDLLKLYDQSRRLVEVNGCSQLSCDDLQTCRAFVETGAGIGLLTDFIGAYSPRPLVRVLPEVASELIPLYFVYPSQKFVPKTLRAFIDFAKAAQLST